MSDTPTSAVWMSLMIGNTRLHWGLFDGHTLIAVRHTPHLVRVNDIQTLIDNGFSYADGQRPQSLWVASVVPEQTALCLQATIDCHVVQCSQVPLADVYPTLGIDRAINLLGAKDRIGWPVLVIDAGTALTFTAGAQRNGEAAIYGGTILPGIRLQGAALRTGTASLEEAIAHSQIAFQQSDLPPRWARDTSGAIASGLIYGTVATLVDTLTDWWQLFPKGSAVLTGGDGAQLHHFVQQKTPEVASRVYLESELAFYGMLAYRRSLVTESDHLNEAS
ncbi:MAG: type III pantothenate kinase [Cyanobacteria bacterium P01_D01_bin.105]